ncbi:efflux RND transporter permease subunit [Holdemania massiliensis]|uniref:MMPL family transporter n=1 Tax=Holdemania massiliensis TaxID=1468449 RepID=A0A6N7S2W9_9FIRM|nr:efflux RND transporter permease subunit [Holdemania massiliensis]MSA70226.1 MMPL family transporter [Holdemania massiliensis]MSA88243.1 MMPL family transporter [Holdemania massiliensis]MSB77072.1 MMPL family transporter [Holdemania massiliensis]MSC31998.1 MMPL family transporter [Holdemania massiliensis]MSC38318.1 MMPL family transporter [Holdemania massiliensis]
MFSKFSVKKPYTVIVGVVMCLLLGVISFMNSTTDLLPEMELPYVVIYSTYPGASAEKVETSLTRILESSVSTTENLSNMSSISSDNLSLIILEFADDTNMDTAMLDLNAKIDLVKGYLDETISSPTLMAINPNMMPIMMATADYDGHDLQGLSDFVNEKVVPELEKTKGVASVDPTGLLEETVQIVLDHQKIDEINNKVLASVDSELAKTERELREKLQEVNDGLQKITDGESELTSTKNETYDKLAQSSVQLQQAATNLIAMDSQITQLKAEQAAFTQIVNGVDQLKTMIEDLGSEATAEEIAAKTEIKIAEIQANLGQLEGRIQSLTSLLQQIQEVPDEEPISEEIKALLQSAGITAEIGNYGQAKALISTMLGELNTVKEQASAGITAMQAALQIVPKYEDAKIKLSNVEIEIATAKGVKQAASSMLTQAGIDVSDLNSLQSKLESGKLTAAGEITKGEMTISSTKTTLESAKTQIEDGLKQIAEARDEALKKANISEALSPSMISTMLTAENFSMPAGYIASNDDSLLIKVGDQFASLEEVENLLLMSMDIDGLEEIRLHDLASVQIVNNSEELYTRVNGNPGIMLSFQKSSTASTADVCKALHKTFEQLSGQYQGLHFSTLMDQGVYIDMIVNSVLENFFYGAILAVIVLILFLRDLKPTIIIALSIPISLMFAMVLMYFSGVTLNIISLSGLALGVGMLVDNSVVVIENIYRMRNEGVGLIDAAIEGAKQVAGAIIASTLTTVCVFLPIVFATGLARQLFVDMGLTIAYSLLASLIVALTLVPMLASKMLKKQNEKKHIFFEKLVNGYTGLLKWSLGHKLIVMGGVIALLIFSTIGVMNMGMTLIPSMDSGQMSVSVSLQNEDAADKECFAMYDQVMERLMLVEGVDTVGVTSGGSGLSTMMGGGGNTSTTFYIITETKADTKKMEAEIPQVLADLPVDAVVSTSNMDLSVLGGSGVAMTLYGDDLDELQASAIQIGNQLKQMEGIDVVDDGQQDPVQEIRVIVDKNEAMKYGLTVAQIYQSVASGIKEETTSTTLAIQNKDYPVVIVQDAASLTQLDNLQDLKLKGTQNQEEKEVELWRIADIENGSGMNSIYRENSRRYVNVSGTIKEGYNVTLVSREVEKQLDISVLPESVTLEFSGENETIMETMLQMVQMILLAIAFIYMIMVAQFQSLLSPFIVMFTIPLAFTGGFLGLLITGQELSIVAMLGFLVLCGVVVNNGIVFIDYANQLKEQGYTTHEAIVETGRTRLRPILMTAMTTILAMTTMALGIGTGSDMMQGMAIVTIGGLTYSTILTLFVVPIMIEVTSRRRDRRKAKEVAADE